MLERRHDLALSQRDLAELFGLPHAPNLSTLLKIFRELGLNLVAEPAVPPF